jgi:hypothetical protein
MSGEAVLVLCDSRGGNQRVCALGRRDFAMNVMQRLPERQRQRLEVRSELQQAALRLFAHRG